MSKLESISHTEIALPDGGFVLILNTGAEIRPESEAMLQALHSRSIGGIKSHLKVLEAKGPENFMANFYVGYGHKSIGDCGTCTIFIEGVSLLAAKAIQDTPLYSGQEASTRYIDFTNQYLFDPVGTEKSKGILESWRAFYLKGLEILQEDLKKRFPKNANEEEKVYNKAIKARAFDIMRGFLPSGAATNLAWHTNFRQAADHLMKLRHHPLAEVRKIADTIEQALKQTYPSSFGHPKFETTENFNKKWMEEVYYYTVSSPTEFKISRNDIDKSSLAKFKSYLQDRKPKTEIPKEVSECGTIQFEFLLDFGSFRDVHRHRAVSQRMPIVTMDHGFEEWYISELPKEFGVEAEKFIAKQKSEIESLCLSKEIAQYYIPIGFRLPNKITGTIPAIVYLAELRATRFVHHTLRQRAIQMAEALNKEFNESGLTVFVDPDADRFDVKRGEHDIVQK